MSAPDELCWSSAVDPVTADWLRRGDAMAAFAHATGATRMNASISQLRRFFRATGERPERVDRLLYLAGGFESDPGPFGLSIELWSRDGRPWCVVSHPLDVDRSRLATIRREFPTVRVVLDQLPNLARGWGEPGSHHVRLELREIRQPYRQPPGTARTRAIARRARQALAEAMGSTDAAWSGPDASWGGVGDSGR